jgi:hypothetical protein
MNLIEDLAMVSLPICESRKLWSQSTEESAGTDNNMKSLTWQGHAPADSARKIRERTRGLPPSPFGYNSPVDAFVE